MHVTPVHEAADLSVPGVAYITHFMFSAFFFVIYSTCNTFSKKQSLVFSVKLRAGFSLLPRNSWSRLPSSAWPKDQGSTKTPPSYFHLQNRCWQSLGTPESTGKHGFSGHRENPSLQGLRMRSLCPAQPQDDASFHPPQILSLMVS